MPDTFDEETLKRLISELSLCSDPQKLSICLTTIIENSGLQEFYASLGQLSVNPECYGALHALLFSMVGPDWLVPEVCNCLAVLDSGGALQSEISVEKEMGLLACVVDKLCQTALVGYFVEKKEEYFCDEDFVGISGRALNCLNALMSLFEKLNSVLMDCERFSSALHHTNASLFSSLKSFSYKALFVCMEHMKENPWTSKETIHKSTELLLIICSVNKCPSIESYLSNSNASVFPQILSDLKPRLLPTTWRRNPSVPYVFSFCLRQVRMPFLSDHLGAVLSAPLLFVDDHEVHYKCLGLEIIRHILDNCSKSELRWYGRADVLYDLLSKQLYSREPEVLEKAIPCLFSVLEIVEQSPLVPGSALKDGKYDEMFREYLRNMSLETLIPIRRVYSGHLPAFIALLGITVVRHLEQLLTVLALYLEVFDGPAELCRFHMLEATRQLLIHAWPRMPTRCYAIIQSLIRLVFDVSSEKTVTPEDVNDRLISKAVECLQLLKQLCPDKVDELLVKLKTLDMNTVVNESIDKVLQSGLAADQMH